MSEQDRMNINEYHYSNYQNILKAINSGDEAEAKAICIREMNIIAEDMVINDYDLEDKIIELDEPEKHI